MILGFAKETYPGENRVAMAPPAIPGLKKAGFEIIMQTGAGQAAGFTDSAYPEKGVTVVASREEVFRKADIVLTVRALGANSKSGKDDIPLLRQGQTIIGLMEPSACQDDIAKLAKAGVNAFSLELIPRITRAQSMDILSSMATVSGYKAVIVAAEYLPQMFPLLMTAAGTVAASHVFIIGAGVAGLQAIATAKRLGAIVQAYDVRAAVKEQVESLGAKFVELPLETKAAEGQGGYAKAMDDDFLNKQRELMAKAVSESDVVISTASVPGKKAPMLITKDMVSRMKWGSVIVDMAAAQGGNCELTQPDTVVKSGEVTILGPTNLASTIPYDASLMFARNVSNFVQYIVQDGALRLDPDDEIVKATLVTGIPAQAVSAKPAQ
jgi:H+-translocating NAD(P) transhydrogenase subunit alpha